MYKAIASAMLTYSPQSSQCCLNTSKTMLYETKYLCNVDPWLTDNVYEKNNLYNIYCINHSGTFHTLPSQCCQCLRQHSQENCSVYTINIGPESTDMFLQESQLYCSFKSLVAWCSTRYNIPEQSFFVVVQCWLGSSFMICGTIINRSQQWQKQTLWNVVLEALHKKKSCSMMS